MSKIISPYTLRLRHSDPDGVERDHSWTVVDYRDNRVGCINYHGHLREGMPRWTWSVGFWLRRSWGAPESGWVHTRERAMVHFKGSWLKSLETMTDDDYAAAEQAQQRQIHQGLEWPRRQGERFARELEAAGYVRIPRAEWMAAGPHAPQWRLPDPEQDT